MLKNKRDALKGRWEEERKKDEMMRENSLLTCMYD